MNTKYSKTLSVFGLLLSLIVPLRMSLLDPGEGGGGGDAPAEPSPMLSRLFGLAEDPPEKPKEGEVVEDTKPGLSLQQAIAEPSADEKAATDKKAADEKAAADKIEADKLAAEKKKTDDAAAAAAAEAERNAAPPIKVKKNPTATEVAAAEAEKKKLADAEAAKGWEKELIDEEREQLELARYAESKNPTKYKGFAARTEKFLKDLKAKTDAADFDPDSDDYKAFLEKERPVLSTSEIRILERERGADIARAEASKQSQDVLDKTFRTIEMPVVKREADEYYAKATVDVLPDDVAKVFKEDKAKAREQFPLEYEIVETVLDEHAGDVEELLALTRRNPHTGNTLKTFDDKNPQHVRVLQLVTDVDSDFKKNGGDALVRNGRRFLTRAELARVPEADRGKYWTFSSKEIAERSTPMVKAKINKAIAEETTRLKRYGFEKKPATAAAAAAPAASTTPPGTRPTPIPSGDGKGGGGSVVDRLLVESGMRAEA